MKRINFPATMPETAPRAVALGFFDGVHLGHRAVLQALMNAVFRTTLIPAVFSFDTLPKLQNAGRLYTAEQTGALFERMGVAEYITADFDAIRALSPEAFVRDVLVGALHATVVCCGENFRFGHGGVGDTAQLTQLGAAYGLTVKVVPAVTVDGQPVSSTRIRAALAAGDMRAVGRLLGRPYTFATTVENGAHLGRQLGTPTINQPFPAGAALPRFGVYASAAVVDGHVHYGVTNIGTKPTVGGTVPLAETWIADFEGDLYGRTVPVTPVVFLRPEQTFPSLAALKDQIGEDAATARRLMTEGRRPRAILFDFDDTLQDRGAAFLAYARDFARHYLPELPPAEQESMAQQITVFNGQGYGVYPAFYGQVRELIGKHEGLSDQEFFHEIEGGFPLYTTLLPGVAEGLQALRDRGYLVGMVTNGYGSVQNRKLDESGLRPLFDVTVVAGDEDVYKPDPELYRRAAAYLGLSPAACVYVGDHPVNDIEGATAAGMTPLFMQASGQFPPPAGVPVVHSMAELLEMVTKL